jgi:protoheme IX farnesyltransferase
LKPAVSVGQEALVAPSPDAALAAEVGSRVSDYLSLTKPRIVLMVLITVGVGYLLGARGSAYKSGLEDRIDFNPMAFALTLLGAGLVAGGASALNQYMERSRDARMRRTSRRALPSGRLAPAEAAFFGSALGFVGTLVLLIGVNGLSAATALVTLLLYVYVYTPLKPHSTLNTAVGAVPGALPPVIGWSAATGGLGIEAWVLFLIVFLWQFPHFLAIAWIYRDDYARGGMKMLPGVDPRGSLTGRQSTLYALALIPAGLLPSIVGLAGPLYFVGAMILGLAYFESAARFWSCVGDVTARRLLRASIVYLPAILLLLVLNPMPA